MRHALKRLRKQAHSFGQFSGTLLFTEKDLDDSFLEEFSELLSPANRGYGFWVWKAQIILQAMRQLTPGDVLVYLDSGSHIIPTGVERFWEYIDLCKVSPIGLLAFQLELPEFQWTKAHVLRHFQVQDKPEIAHSGQVQAGLIIIQHRDSAIRFLEQWLDSLRGDIHLIDDELSEQEVTNFQAHRNDQSVFSILAKISGAALQSAREQDPEYGDDLDLDFSQRPFLHRRDRLSRFEIVVRHLLNFCFKWNPGVSSRLFNRYRKLRWGHE